MKHDFEESEFIHTKFDTQISQIHPRIFLYLHTWGFKGITIWYVSLSYKDAHQPKTETRTGLSTYFLYTKRNLSLFIFRKKTPKTNIYLYFELYNSVRIVNHHHHHPHHLQRTHTWVLKSGLIAVQHLKGTLHISSAGIWWGIHSCVASQYQINLADSISL